MRVLFLINVDWFFVSHFLHLARRAKAAGCKVALATNFENKRELIEAEGFELIELGARRGGILPAGLAGAVSAVADDLKRSPATIVHGFGLFGIAAGTLASLRARHHGSVYYITGRGYTAVSPSLGARAVRLGSRLFCRLLADGPETRWMAENSEDIRSLCPDKAVAEGRTAIVGGAGIDPDVFHARAMPPRPPFRVGLVGRMIWSKGVDLAVAAVGLAQQRGLEVRLTIAGGLDPGNPASLSEGEMRRFEREPGVQWLGAVKDIDGFWAEQHVGILPSRGGEGVPRSLIEAAACGRPIVTTDVPGCRELAVETEGWSVASESAEALADALFEAADADLERRGAAARAAILANYTQEKNWQAAARFYEELARTPA